MSTPTTAPPAWRLSPAGWLPLDRPRVIAILNATPDSFSDGGRHLTPASAAAAAGAFVADGADMLDVGGESTRPGASRVPPAEQIARVVPVIRAIRDAGVGVPISVDTTLAAVAAAAIDAGADAINDVSGGADDPGLIPLAAERGCGLILMHRLAPPDQDRYSDRYDYPPRYTDVVGEVAGALLRMAEAAERAGCDRRAIVVDPGLGFGKSVEQNVDLVRGTPRLCALGYPVLGAASRKSFVGRLAMGDAEAEPAAPAERVAGSIAFSLAQLAGGVRLFRVHDVRAQAEALRAGWALHRPPGGADGSRPGGVSGRADPHYHCDGS